MINPLEYRVMDYIRSQNANLGLSPTPVQIALGTGIDLPVVKNVLFVLENVVGVLEHGPPEQT